MGRNWKEKNEGFFQCCLRLLIYYTAQTPICIEGFQCSTAEFLLKTSICGRLENLDCNRSLFVGSVVELPVKSLKMHLPLNNYCSDRLICNSVANSFYKLQTR